MSNGACGEESCDVLDDLAKGESKLGRLSKADLNATQSTRGSLRCAFGIF